MMTQELNSNKSLAYKSGLDCNSGGDENKIFRSHLFRTSNTCERCGLPKKFIMHMRARAKSGRADETGSMHFALIKSADQDARTGIRIDAMTAAKRLLDEGIWPLWENTPGRIVVAANDRVCVYLSGVGAIIATARIINVQPWSRSFAESYPLVLGGTPELVLCLADIVFSDFPEAVANHIEQLNCVGKNKKKWGAAFCGGMRSLTKHDFNLLTRSTLNS